MKKVQLPLSENFIIHAVALLNKVHQDKLLPLKDVQHDAILHARSRSFSLRHADEHTLFRRIGL